MKVIADFFDISETRSVLDEAADLMTTVQQAKLQRHVSRLQEHGWDLNGDYFSKVKGIRETLYEYRLSIDKVEFRFLFSDERGTFVMLAVYKEKRNDVPSGAIESATTRLAIWRARNANR